MNAPMHKPLPAIRFEVENAEYTVVSEAYRGGRRMTTQPWYVLTHRQVEHRDRVQSKQNGGLTKSNGGVNVRQTIQISMGTKPDQFCFAIG